MSLDTLSIARELREADVAPAQAEAIASAIGKAVSDGAAAKSDIDVLVAKIEGSEARIASQLEALEHRLTAKIEATRSSLLIWLIGVLLAGAGLIVTLGRIYLT